MPDHVWSGTFQTRPDVLLGQRPCVLGAHRPRRGSARWKAVAAVCRVRPPTLGQELGQGRAAGQSSAAPAERVVHQAPSLESRGGQVDRPRIAFRPFARSAPMVICRVQDFIDAQLRGGPLLRLRAFAGYLLAGATANHFGLGHSASTSSERGGATRRFPGIKVASRITVASSGHSGAVFACGSDFDTAACFDLLRCNLSPPKALVKAVALLSFVTHRGYTRRVERP